MTFKVGDRVRVNLPDISCHGRIGYVHSFEEKWGFPFVVRFKDDPEAVFRASELELVEDEPAGDATGDTSPRGDGVSGAEVQHDGTADATHTGTTDTLTGGRGLIWAGTGVVKKFRFHRMTSLAGQGARDETEREFTDHVSEVLDEIGELIVMRHRKYGPKNISNSPFGARQGLVTRAYDKLARLANTSVDFDDESEMDAWMDLAGYSIIGLLVKRGEWPS